MVRYDDSSFDLVTLKFTTSLFCQLTNDWANILVLLPILQSYWTVKTKINNCVSINTQLRTDDIEKNFDEDKKKTKKQYRPKINEK